MSKRLQVLLPDSEMDELQRIADSEKVTVGEWVRQALRNERARKSSKDPAAKIKAIRDAAKLEFPTADIDQMLAEIAQGYPH